MSLRTINEAEHVAFLVTGGHKADALAAVLGQSGRRDARLPAAMVRPGRGRLLWFVDDAAAQPTRGGEDPGC
jgi:6-phosphogluconolactonase